MDGVDVSDGMGVLLGVDISVGVNVKVGVIVSEAVAGTDVLLAASTAGTVPVGATVAAVEGFGRLQADNAKTSKKNIGKVCTFAIPDVLFMEKVF